MVCPTDSWRCFVAQTGLCHMVAAIVGRLIHIRFGSNQELPAATYVDVGALLIA